MKLREVDNICEITANFKSLKSLIQFIDKEKNKVLFEKLVDNGTEFNMDIWRRASKDVTEVLPVDENGAVIGFKIDDGEFGFDGIHKEYFSRVITEDTTIECEMLRFDYFYKKIDASQMIDVINGLTEKFGEDLSNVIIGCNDSYNSTTFKLSSTKCKRSPKWFARSLKDMNNYFNNLITDYPIDMNAFYYTNITNWTGVFKDFNTDVLRFVNNKCDIYLRWAPKPDFGVNSSCSLNLSYMFYQKTFENNTSVNIHLREIPSVSFHTLNMSYMFYATKNIDNITFNIDKMYWSYFIHLTSCFADVTATKLPFVVGDLAKPNTGCRVFCTEMFRYADVIIPENIFSSGKFDYSYDNNYSGFSMTFFQSKIKSIPENLFSGTCVNPKLGFQLNRVFDSCYNLNNLPKSLGEITSTQISLYRLFSSTKITEIPSILFEKFKNVDLMNDIFARTDITVIPENLINANWDLKSMEGAFADCKKLTHAPDYWNQFPRASGVNCFKGCINTDNYFDIPKEWGGSNITNDFSITIGQRDSGGYYGYSAEESYGSITNNNMITPWRWRIISLNASVFIKTLTLKFKVGINPVSDDCPGNKEDDLWNLYTWKITIGDKTSVFDNLDDHKISDGIHEWIFEVKNDSDWDAYLASKLDQTLKVKIEYSKK